ncbi:hypothetical protein OsI_10542 [Oryza sativa Indica Group]|uniref:At1g61320/AtMIF1 LRR domain-containing protein n=1 Tax=Oryza sativa subsp. indica TaxID=39946 RepID=B8AQU6_ORYSI|nr:hypothetical protein OsI_10542 [Oryza sativa Indica Group]
MAALEMGGGRCTSAGRMGVEEAVMGLGRRKRAEWQQRKRGAHDPAPPPPGSGAAQRLGKGEAASRDGVVGVKMNGTGMKKFEIEFYGPSNANTYYHLNNWLEIAITSGIEELTLRLTPDVTKYNFPCSLLSDGRGDLIQSLHLSHCSFRPTVEVVSLRSLTSLDLCLVRITDRELGILLSNSLVLEKLGIKYCDKINCLKIPCVLERLSSLEVFECYSLQMVESKAPNLCSFCFGGEQVQFSIGEPLQMKNLQVIFPNSISFGRAELPFSMPNLETLNISSRCEMSHTPTAPGKFLHLRYLSITFAGWRFSRAYDYFSLVSFLDASPLLETFILCILQKGKHDLTLRDPIYPRQMSERQHDSLKNVKINGFSSTKSLVELTCHILQNTTSLECLTLDTTRIEFRCSDSSVDVCLPSDRDAIKGAHKALLAIRTYIEGIVPATVKFSVLEPCRRCYAW